jgi:hypothetical protein
VVAAAVRTRNSGTDELFLLTADRRVLVVSATDTLTELARAPSGVAAIAAVPAGTDDAGPALLLAGSVLAAWNRQGRELWSRPVPGLARIDSLFFAYWDEGRPRFLAWQDGRSWLVLVDPGRVSATRFDPGFTPTHTLLADIDNDGRPEFTATDGGQLAIQEMDGSRELRFRWSVATGRAAPGPSLLAAGDVDGNDRAELLVLTGDTLRCLRPTTGVRAWTVTPRERTHFAAVTTAGSNVYVSGFGPDGAWFVSRVSAGGTDTGSCQATFPLPVRVAGLARLGDWPLVFTTAGPARDNVLLLPPGLGTADGNSPGYNGVQLFRFLPMRLGPDAFPDAVVVRSGAGGRLWVDAFTNRLGQLTAELARARAELHSAVLGHDGDEVQRLSRRVRLLARELDPGPGGIGQEELLLREYRRQARTRTIVPYAVGSVGAVLLMLLLFGAVRLRQRARRYPASHQIENKPLPVRVALASDLVAIDHNFIAKGNIPAAVNRLVEIRDRHGLTRDRDLLRITSLEPTPPGRQPTLDPKRISPRPFIDAYTAVTTRLIHHTYALDVLELFKTAAASALTTRELGIHEVTRHEHRRLASPDTAATHPPLPHAYSIVLVRSPEKPDIYPQLRILANPQTRAAFEHIVIDHFRYARNWAYISLEYIVNTNWSRRLLVTLHSDSDRTINLANPAGHLVAQLLELSTAYRPAIELPFYDYTPAVPTEKLWLSIADLVTVLDDTRQRLTGPPRSAL